MTKVIKEAEVKAKQGLHLRPGAEFVKLAKSFNSNITITANKKTANAKSLLKVQTLGIVKGNKVIIEAEGEEAKQAVDRLTDFVESYTE